MIQTKTISSSTYFCVVCALICVLFGCSNDAKVVIGDEESPIGNYKAEVIDSVVLNRLSPAQLRAYNEQTGELLLESDETGEVLVINEKGETISQFRPYVEGPNYTEDANFGWAFLGRDELVAYGRVYFHRLTKSGDRIERIPYPVEVRGWVYRDHYPVNIFGIGEGKEAEVLYIVPGISSGFKARSQEYMDSVKKIFAFNKETKINRALAGVPAESDYRTMGMYVDSATPVMSKVKGSTFVTVYNADSKIFVHDVSTNELLNTLEIPQEYLPEFKAVPFGSKKNPELIRYNAKLFSTGDHIILTNIGNIPEDVFRNILEQPNPMESPELEAAIRQYMTEINMVFDKNGFLGLLNRDDLKEKFLLPVSTEQGFFWQQRTYEDERDYLTFLKVKVVKEKR